MENDGKNCHLDSFIYFYAINLSSNKPLHLSKMKKTTLLLLLLLFIVTRCDKEPGQDDQYDTQLAFPSTIIEGKSSPSEAVMQWHQGAQIGVSTEGIPVHRNIPFSTNGTGYFSSSTPIYFPKGEDSFNVIAYYPYNPGISGNTLSVDLATDQQIILYSNNLKGITAANKNKMNKLIFVHLLQRIHIRLSALDETLLTGNMEANLKGSTKGIVSLSDGSVTVQEGSIGIIPLEITGTGSERTISGLLLPSVGSSVELTIMVDELQYKWTIPLTGKENYVYSYGVVLGEGNLKVSAPLTEGSDAEAYSIYPVSSNNPPPVIPSNPDDGEAPAAQIYMETPVPAGGSIPPDSYQVTHMISNLSWLNNSKATGEVRNYTIHYDTDETYPVWVAYPLHPTYMRSGNRTDDWQYDPLIPVEFQPDLSSAWQTRTVSRGHMLPSASRSASLNLNRTTFYFTNMVAQNSEMNATTWNDLEVKVRYWRRQTEYDTLYVVTGAILPSPPETISYALDAAGRKAAIPKYLYKALCRKNKQTGEYSSIAFKMENSTTGIDYTRSVLSVEEVEQLTGFTFFSKLPAAVATEVKKQKSLSKWN